LFNYLGGTTAMNAPHPQIKAMLEAMAQANLPAMSDLAPTAARAQMEAMGVGRPAVDSPPLGNVQDIEMPGPGGKLKVRHYVPKDAKLRGTMVYLHGGGWVLGNLETSDSLCRRLAASSGCEVYSIDYRLAPEYPYPAALDDSVAAVKWAAGKSKLPLFIGGDSAGGNLAAACALRLRDAGGPQLAGQVLVYPVTDHDFETTSYRVNGAGGLLLTTKDMKYYWGHYVADAVKRNDPLVAPLRAKSLAGLPPALVIVAGLDPLCDEGIAYANRLKADGVKTELRRYDDMIHGFLAFIGIIEPANGIADDAGAWMKAHT
jgi:acetyl esterase